jgi:hypothetical protein
MIEGYTFILGSLLINFIPIHMKNFNMLCLFGVFLYSIGMFVGGPVWFIEIERTMGIYYFILSVGLTGFA